MQRRRAIAVLVSMVGGLAACGGDEQASSPTPAVAPAATQGTGAVTTAPANTGPSSTAPDTTALAAPVTDPATTLPAPEPTMFTGDADSEWCAAAAEVEAFDEEFENVAFDDPEAVEQAVTTMLSKMEAAEQFAPPELRDALATTLTGTRSLIQALADADYDFFNADLSVLDDPTVTEAGDLIDRYNVEVCELDIDLSEEQSSDDGFDPSAGTLREQITAQLVQLGFTDGEAACIIEQIDFSAVEQLDEQTMLEAFEACDISLTRLGEISG